MNSIKKKAIQGFLYSFVGLTANYGIALIVGIILARLLTPNDYGVFGMVAIFIAISTTFTDSGMTTALIREKEVDEDTYSTVFIYNLIVSIIIYIILFVSAGMIGDFFNEPQLVAIIRVIGINIIIGAFANIQSVKLSRDLNFRAQARIDIIASVISSILGITLAYRNFGVWSLVVMNVASRLLSSTLLIYTNSWKPNFTFDVKVFKRLFGFGYKMLITGLLATLYQNVYNLIIGKTYTSDVLGYYSKAKTTNDTVSNTIIGTISKVGFPLLSNMQGDKQQFSNGFRKLIKHISFITMPVFIGLFAVSETLVLTLFGTQWLGMVPFIKVLCISSVLYAHNALNLNVLQVVGRSDLFLKIDSIKIFIGTTMITLVMILNLGMNALLATILISTLIAFFANAFYSKKYIDYGILSQIKDMTKPMLISLIMGAEVIFLSSALSIQPSLKLIVLIIVGMMSYVLLSMLFRIEEFYSILELLKGALSKKK